jgi:hypothetical protein
VCHESVAGQMKRKSISAATRFAKMSSASADGCLHADLYTIGFIEFLSTAAIHGQTQTVSGAMADR